MGDGERRSGEVGSQKENKAKDVQNGMVCI